MIAGDDRRLVGVCTGRRCPDGDEQGKDQQFVHWGPPGSMSVPAVMMTRTLLRTTKHVFVSVQSAPMPVTIILPRSILTGASVVARLLARSNRQTEVVKTISTLLLA